MNGALQRGGGAVGRRAGGEREARGRGAAGAPGTVLAAAVLPEGPRVRCKPGSSSPVPRRGAGRPGTGKSRQARPADYFSLAQAASGEEYGPFVSALVRASNKKTSLGTGVQHGRLPSSEAPELSSSAQSQLPQRDFNLIYFLSSEHLLSHV